ncbi:MAG: hypothetical protein ACTSW1_13990 [Candidatus Hodarchaeales archaeon]
MNRIQNKVTITPFKAIYYAYEKILMVTNLIQSRPMPPKKGETQ